MCHCKRDFRSPCNTYVSLYLFLQVSWILKEMVLEFLILWATRVLCKDISVLLGGDPFFPCKFLAKMQRITHFLSHKLKKLPSKWVQVLHQCSGGHSLADLNLTNLDALNKVVMKMPPKANHLTTCSPHRVSIPSGTLLQASQVPWV